MTGPGADLFAFIAQKVEFVLPQQKNMDDFISDLPILHAEALITYFTTTRSIFSIMYELTYEPRGPRVSTHVCLAGQFGF